MSTESLGPDPEFLSSIREEQLNHELERHAAKSPGGDKWLSAFCRGVLVERDLEDLDSHPDLLGPVLDELLDSRQTLAPYHAIQFMHNLFKKHWMKESDYPAAAISPDWIVEHIQKTLHDDLASEELHIDLLIRNIQTNIAERYKTLKMLLNGFHYPRILDVGSSQNLGLKALAINHPFMPIYGVQSGNNVEEMIADPLLSRRGNKLIRQHLNLGPCVGVDVMPIDAESVAWVRSNFKSKELLHPDKGVVAEFDALTQKPQPPNVISLQADFSCPEQMSVLRQRGYKEHSFDALVYSYVKYMVSSDEREAMDDVGKRWLKPDGFVVIQDWAYVDDETPDRVEYYDEFQERPFTHTTIVRDMSEARPYYREVLHWENGRYEKVQRGAGLAGLRGALGRL